MSHKNILQIFCDLIVVCAASKEQEIKDRSPMYQSLALRFAKNSCFSHQLTKTPLYKFIAKQPSSGTVNTASRISSVNATTTEKANDNEGFRPS